MLQSFKMKNFNEVVSEIKISKVVFTCVMLIVAIFAGICCQINQTEQNATYVKKYLANKKGYYSNLVSNMRRVVTEKYYGTTNKTEEFSEAFVSSFYSSLNRNPNHNLKEGVVFMQLKYLNDYFSEILERTISQETVESQLNRFLDLRFSAQANPFSQARDQATSNTQANFSSTRVQILNNTAAKVDQLMASERITIDPVILEAFITPLVEVYYNQLITISFSRASSHQSSPAFRFIILSLPILLLLFCLITGYFFFTSIGGRLTIFCLVLALFFVAFNLQAPASNQNIDLTYNQLNLFAY